MQLINLISKKNKIRVIVFTADLAIHALVIILIIWLNTLPARKTKHPAADAQIVLTTIKINPSHSTEPKTPPLPIQSHAASPVIADIQPVKTVTSQVKTSENQEACTLSTDIAKTIEGDKLALAAISDAPPTIKSEADAIMIWNGTWTIQRPSDTPLADNLTEPKPQPDLLIPLRDLVEKSIAAASESCQHTALRGPQFLSVHTSNRVFTIVIGSGDWRWIDLLTNTQVNSQTM